MKEKRELIRVVRDGSGRVALDPTGRAPGRGAYLCRNVACLEKAVKTRAFERSFGVSVPPEAYANVRSELSDHE